MLLKCKLNISKWNKGFEDLLMVTDVFSKYRWKKPLKDKKGEIVTEAFLNGLKRPSSKVDNHNIYGLTRVRSSIINISKGY